MPCLRVLFAVSLLTAGAAGAGAATLSLSVGGEITDLEITYCATEPRVSGQLRIAAEVTAVGRFRGEPAALLLSKSVPMAGGPGFEQFDLYLTELPPELRTMPTVEAGSRILSDQADLHQRRSREAAAGLARDELEKLPPEELAAYFEEQVRQMEEVEREMEALKPPQARGFGSVTVQGSTIRFQGDELRRIEGEAGPFADLDGSVRVEAVCAR